LIRANNIWNGGDTLTQDLNVMDIYSQIVKLSKDSGHDFSIWPKVSTSLLTFNANWFEKMGTKIDDATLTLVLIPGKNIELGNPSLIEQGMIYNDYMAFGTGDTWTDRPLFFTQDRPSQSIYGTRQSPGLEVDGTTKEQLSTAALSAMKNTREAHRTFNISVLDDASHMVSYIHPGNTLKLEMDNVGWRNGKVGVSTWIRILGMDYDDETRFCGIVAEEVT
jgi:hypothetical protein